MKRVYVFSKIPGLAEAVRNFLPLANVESNTWSPTPDSEVTTSLKKAQYVVLDSDFYGHNKSLLEQVQWVQLTWAGVESLVASSKGWKEFPAYPVTRYSGSHMSLQMAEYVVGQIISKERNFPQQHDFQTKAYWGNSDVKHYRSLGDLTISVLGLGQIGSKVAEVLKMFGATIFAIGRTKRNRIYSLGHPKGRNRKATIIATGLSHLTTEELEEVLKVSDYIVSILPNTPETTNLLGGNILQACTKSPVLVNVGRGNVIREEDLAAALEKGWISGAILDVFQEEPLPADSILWSLPEVIISPHVSAVSRPQDVAECFAENYTRLEQGLKPLLIIDWEKGY